MAHNAGANTLFSAANNIRPIPIFRKKYVSCISQQGIIRTCVAANKKSSMKNISVYIDLAFCFIFLPLMIFIFPMGKVVGNLSAVFHLVYRMALRHLLHM